MDSDRAPCSCSQRPLCIASLSCWKHILHQFFDKLSCCIPFKWKNTVRHCETFCVIHILFASLQWAHCPHFCSLRAGLRCFHVWLTWSETSGLTASSCPRTTSLPPTVSIGRTADWWAAPTPTLSSTWPPRTAGGATSAWWPRLCVALPGPHWLMRDLLHTPAGFTKAPAGRRTAWPCITVSRVHSSFLVASKRQ